MKISNINRRSFLTTGIGGTAGLKTAWALPHKFFGLSPYAKSNMAPENQVPFDLRYRQVHLDFHTSEDITGIGEQFDPDEFASTLQKARVNSITCFARCHHGWIYYDTKKFPERRHPHLTRNLVPEQIEACHKRNIRVPIYVTVQWDHFTAREHPEWLQVSVDGAFVGTPPYEAGFYRRLCMNSPYVDFLKAFLTELFESAPVDGLFLDIVHAQDCSCKYCLAGMDREGIDPSNTVLRQQYGYSVFKNFIDDNTAFIKQLDRTCSIFYNSGHIGPRHRNVIGGYTHLELESLPSGGWGYLHFPLTQRYARNLGIDCMGMTGKFHTSWGDFHSLKNKAALQFECFNMLALNGKCSIGDQLHPGGRIDPYTYELIGSVYSEIEKKEPWCIGARPITEIGVLTPEEFSGSTSRTAIPLIAFGAVRMLQEGGHQFDVLDSQSDFSKYKVLVLPDVIPATGELTPKLNNYVSSGGSLIASFESGLFEDKSDFGIKALGVRKLSDGPRDSNGELACGRAYPGNDYCEYIIPRGQIGKGLPETEHVMYMKGLDVETMAGSVSLASVTKSYFDRTYAHFCSHRQTPSSGKTGNPAIVRNGKAIYFSHPIFAQYQKNAPRWCKVLFLNALDILLPEPIVRIEAPTTTIVTVNEQAEKRRWIIHLLHYIPERRGEDFDIIEDVIPLSGVKVSAKAPGSVKKISCVPQMYNLDFRAWGERVEFVLPELNGHQMVEVSF